jgi:ABC-type lipoprotein release transport system permease subunit
MSAIWMVARAEMRRRWGSIAVLTVLVGLVGVVVVASASGARRTATSMDRFEEYTRSADVEINAGDATSEQLEEFRAVKGVAKVAVLRQLAMFQEDVDAFLPVAGQLDNAFGTEVDRARLVSGRRAHRADELTIGETLADALGISVGDRVRFSSYSPEQILTNRLSDDDGALGPQVTFRVVGIVRRPPRPRWPRCDWRRRRADRGVRARTWRRDRELLRERAARAHRER